MARVYVSGSIRDIERVRLLQDDLKAAGHTITHDWTLYNGPKDNHDEAERQLMGIRSADVLICVIHPRLKAGWMELGAAIIKRIPCIVIPHPDVSDSMWYSLPNVHLTGGSPVHEVELLV